MKYSNFFFHPSLYAHYGRQEFVSTFYLLIHFLEASRFTASSFIFRNFLYLSRSVSSILPFQFFLGLPFFFSRLYFLLRSNLFSFFLTICSYHFNCIFSILLAHWFTFSLFSSFVPISFPTIFLYLKFSIFLYWIHKPIHFPCLSLSIAKNKTKNKMNWPKINFFWPVLVVFHSKWFCGDWSSRMLFIINRMLGKFCLLVPFKEMNRLQIFLKI